jgi:hypothetical protein
MLFGRAGEQRTPIKKLGTCSFGAGNIIYIPNYPGPASIQQQMGDALKGFWIVQKDETSCHAPELSLLTDMDTLQDTPYDDEKGTKYSKPGVQTGAYVIVEHVCKFYFILVDSVIAQLLTKHCPHRRNTVPEKLHGPSSRKRRD